MKNGEKLVIAIEQKNPNTQNYYLRSNARERATSVDLSVSHRRKKNRSKLCLYINNRDARQFQRAIISLRKYVPDHLNTRDFQILNVCL